MVEKRPQERRQQERRKQERRWQIAPGAALRDGLAGREVVMNIDSIAGLVPEIRAVAPDLPLERVEAIAIGIWRDCGGSRARSRRSSAP